MKQCPSGFARAWRISCWRQLRDNRILHAAFSWERWHLRLRSAIGREPPWDFCGASCSLLCAGGRTAIFPLSLLKNGHTSVQELTGYCFLFLSARRSAAPFDSLIVRGRGFVPPICRR